MALYNALIRTHHITSRKKVAILKSAAKALNVSCLIRSGGSPGVMYVEGDEDGVKEWVATVQRLKYKDYQLTSRPSNIEEDVELLAATKDSEENSRNAAGKTNTPYDQPVSIQAGSLEEVESVKEFGLEMQRRGIWMWWRKGMGFSN